LGHTRSWAIVGWCKPETPCPRLEIYCKKNRTGRKMTTYIKKKKKSLRGGTRGGGGAGKTLSRNRREGTLNRAVIQKKNGTGKRDEGQGSTKGEVG